jgi:sterol desaturase/sphingolipid hydroxylase (fatty acid hydroxylase superfamily)
VLNGFLEHANLRVSRWADRVLALVTTWPNVHKLHHSRDPSETDTNFGNIFVWFDRLFSTYTPSWKGERVAYGLEGCDGPESQQLGSLLALPFRETSGAPLPDGARLHRRGDRCRNRR